MVHDSIRNLRLDKRLLRRKNWIGPAELERALEELPDVSGKAELSAPEEPKATPAGSDGGREA